MLILWLPGIFELVFSITTVCENDSSSHFPNYLYKNQNCAPAKTACDSSFVRTVTLPRDATVIEQQGLPAGINCQEPIGFLSNILTVGPVYTIAQCWQRRFILLLRSPLQGQEVC